MLGVVFVLLACRPAARSGPDTDDAPEVGSGGEVLITEVMSDNEGALKDGDGDTPDWIELFNAGEARVDLDGWGLSDDPGDPFAWTFEPSLMLPGEYRVVFASRKDDQRPEGEVHTNFALDRDGESLTLTRPDGSRAAALEVPALPADVSYGLGQIVRSESVLGRARVSAAPVDGWRGADFEDGAWADVALGIGFDGAVADAVIEDAALEKPTRQSSDGYGYTGLQAVDGDPSTFSHTADADLAPWWEVDLGADFAVSRVTLINRSDCCAERLYNVTVSLSDAEGAAVWRSDVINPVAEGDGPVSPGGTVSVPVEPPRPARAVRVEKVAVNGAYSAEWLSLAEVVVTGRAASPYAGDIVTDVTEVVAGGARSLAVRLPFALDEPPTRATLSVRYDDGFSAWIDGAPVASANAGAPVAQSGTAVAPLDRLGAGAHVLAMQVDNVAADDDDLLLAPTLTVDWISTGSAAYFWDSTPGAPNGAGVAGIAAAPVVDPPRGFFEAPFSATITSPTAGATLVYTLDGRAPSLTHGVQVPPDDSGVAVAQIDVPSTTVLRAAAFLDGWATSPVVTDTWLFLDDVIRQPARPEGVPVTWDSRSEGPYAADYEMDPEVVDDPRTHADLLAGLREIPTLSIVMDPDDLFGAEGIYANSAERGDAWRRAASVELILPDGATGFAEDCGVVIHGWGWRYHASTLKHSLRLEFSRDYGDAKLDYPWFADAPVSRFDSVVLRAGGSKSWLDFRDPAQAQYLHDAFARDTARDMGKVDGHATYVHLYLNGLYWGLYDPVERPEADFGAAYFGGDADEYDAINRRTVTNEAVDGDLVAFDALVALADADVSTAEGYAAIGRYLDIDDLIDYMLIHQYTANRDGPCCFEANNMRGVRRRLEGETFRFFVWDMEYSLWDADDAINVDIDVPGSIVHVYARLRENAAFRARYAERARRHLTGDGALTAAVAAARYEARADEIFNPLLAESARWGDTYREAPYTRDVEWQAEYARLMTEFFPRRTDALIEQLTEAGLYVP